MKATLLRTTHMIAAGEFKAKCLRLMDDAEEENLRFVVTKRGRAVGQWLPMSMSDAPESSLWGIAPHAKIKGDVMRSFEWGDSGKKWRKANQDQTR